MNISTAKPQVFWTIMYQSSTFMGQNINNPVSTILQTLDHCNKTSDGKETLSQTTKFHLNLSRVSNRVGDSTRNLLYNGYMHPIFLSQSC